MKVTKAVIPCAGFGTRFLPATKVCPKELFPIVDTPALVYLVEEAAASGIKDVLIIISPQKSQIKKLFKANSELNKLLKANSKKQEYRQANRRYGVKVHFAVQKVMDGNGSAIKLAKDFAKGEPFAVLFGDDLMYTGDKDPVTKQLVDAYEKSNKTIVGVQKTSEEVARRCGVMITGQKYDEKTTEVLGIKEKPQDELPSELVSLGRYVLSNDIFDAIDRAPVKNGEVYLTDAISLLAEEGKGVAAYEFDARRYDIGNKEGYLEAVVEYALRDKKLKGDFSEYLKTIK